LPVVSAFQLLIASLRHYWRWHLGLALCVAIGAAVISGSLAVGDSVRETLRRRAAERLGNIRSAVIGNERFFTAALAGRIPGRAAAVIVVRGTVANAAGTARVAGVNVIGVDGTFRDLALAPAAPRPASGSAVINRPLEKALGNSGDVLIRLEKPGALSRDAPLSGESDQTVTLRATLAGVVAPEALGDFTLSGGAAAPKNLFVPLGALQQALEQPGRANVIVTDSGGGVEAALRSAWTLADAGLELKQPGDGSWEVSTPRVFLDPPVAAKLRRLFPDARGVLTYLVNEIRGPGPTATPYSFATAAEEVFDLGPDEVAVTQWLADDLGVKPGDPLAVKYFHFGRGRRMEETRAAFTVKTVVPMEHPAVNPGWTPAFPGVMDQPSCRLWKPGIKLDMTTIRQKDEDYWSAFRGTPKIFLSPETGRKLWANRFGELTSLRLPAGAVADEAEFLTKLQSVVEPGDFGLRVAGVAEAARAAVDQSYDLGALFLGMSFFLVVTALLLTGLMFLFTIESRASQLGLLKAVGIDPRRMRRIIMLEAAASVLPGTIFGLAGGVLYAAIVLRVLSGNWSGAVPDMEFATEFRPQTLAAAAFGTAILALAVVWLSTRRLQRAQPRELITAGGGASVTLSPSSGGVRASGVWWRRGSLMLAPLLIVGAAALAISGGRTPAVFFVAGTLLMLGGIELIRLALRWAGRGTAGGLSSVWQLGVRNTTRRRGRSLAVAGLLAAGVFMIAAMDAFRLDASTGANDRGSGTGGFALIGESTLPVYDDLNSATGREAYNLEEDEMRGVSVVAMRVREGDEASCLNLERPQNPRVLGVDPAAFASRRAFTFAEGSGWHILDEPAGAGAIPAVMDANYVRYTLKLKAGDTLEIDGAGGGTVRLRIAGLLAPSVLQGAAIISESAFLRAFPDAGGYRDFLIDVPHERRQAVIRVLTRMLENRGLALTPAVERLAEFNAVQNTYLRIFTALGGLGLILSTAGLGLLLARNLLERRAEFGVLQAVGLRSGTLRGLVAGENIMLLAAGLAVGVASALVAVWPVSGSASLPFGTIALILLSGVVFCALAARLAMRGNLIEAIRCE
jgi:putative ABC transport system permease protein